MCVLRERHRNLRVQRTAGATVRVRQSVRETAVASARLRSCALFPRTLVVADLAPLQVEAFLTAAVLVLGLQAVSCFTQHAPSRGEQR